MAEYGYVTMRNEDGTHYWMQDQYWEGFANCSRKEAKRVSREEFEALEAKAEATRKNDCPDNGFFGWYNVTFHPES